MGAQRFEIGDGTAAEERPQTIPRAGDQEILDIEQYVGLF
jgi:hypothetical protein